MRWAYSNTVCCTSACTVLLSLVSWFEIFSLTLLLMIRNMLFVVKRAKCSLLCSILFFEIQLSLWSPTSLNIYLFPEQYLKNRYFLTSSEKLQLVQVIPCCCLVPEYTGVMFPRFCLVSGSGEELPLQVNQYFKCCQGYIWPLG